MLALLRGNEDGWTSALILGEAAGARRAARRVRAWSSRAAAAPMLPLRLFRDRSFSGAQIAAFAISASFFAIFLYTTLYLQQILGLSAIEAGLVYLPGTITMLFVSGATSALGAKVSARLMVAGGLALVSAGMVLFTLAGVGSSWAIVLPGAMVALIGTGLFNPALTAVALGTVSTEQSGVAAGVNDTFRQAGIAVGVAALGALIPAQAAFGGGSPQEYVDGLHDALLAGAALAAAGAVAAWFLISPAFGAAAPVAAERPGRRSPAGVVARRARASSPPEPVPADRRRWIAVRGGDPQQERLRALDDDVALVGEDEVEHLVVQRSRPCRPPARRASRRSARRARGRSRCPAADRPRGCSRRAGPGRGWAAGRPRTPRRTRGSRRAPRRRCRCRPSTRGRPGSC